MVKITVEIKFKGRTAYIHLSDGTRWLKELPNGQTQEQFAAQIEQMVMETLGDKVHKLVKTTEYAS